MTRPDQARDRVVAIDRLRREGATFADALAAISLYPDSQFEVIMVRGPNRRNDFHIDPYDELFIQLEGTIRVDTREPEGGLRHNLVHADELFLVPAGVPHSPLRPADTLGLVVEIRRGPDDTEGVEWYCHRCGALIEHVTMQSPQMIESLGRLLSEFQASEARRTCRSCGTVLPQPGPVTLGETA
jgi:3-hydroxyanthranilate 3,4-dioxygenase